MPLYIPTDKVVDERVLRSFYALMARESQRQGFSPAVFPVWGDLSLGELMDDLRAGRNLGHYRMVIALSNFSLPKSRTDVDDKKVDPRVLDSYKGWLRDIGEDRAQRKLHQVVLAGLIKRQPKNAVRWNRADELSGRQRDSLTANELAELQDLEATLDSSDYLALKDSIKPELVEAETKKVANEYQLPGTGISLAEALTKIEAGSFHELYRRLVKIHEGFEFKVRTIA